MLAISNDAFSILKFVLENDEVAEKAIMERKRGQDRWSVYDVVCSNGNTITLPGSINTDLSEFIGDLLAYGLVDIIFSNRFERKFKVTKKGISFLNDTP